MITKNDLMKLLKILGFSQDGAFFNKQYNSSGTELRVDTKAEHIYYSEAGISVGRETTSNFSEPENFVVLECVDRLLSKGYRASTERIKALTIRVPSIEIQQETVEKVIEIEDRIEVLKQQIKECKARKQSILDRYLK